MKGKFLMGIVLILVISGLVFALPNNRGIDKAKEKSRAIDSDGNVDPPEHELVRVDFIRYAPGKEKTCNDNGVCDRGDRGDFSRGSVHRDSDSDR